MPWSCNFEIDILFDYFPTSIHIYSCGCNNILLWFCLINCYFCNTLNQICGYCVVVLLYLESITCIIMYLSSSSVSYASTYLGKDMPISASCLENTNASFSCGGACLYKKYTQKAYLGGISNNYCRNNKTEFGRLLLFVLFIK